MALDSYSKDGTYESKGDVNRVSAPNIYVCTAGTTSRSLRDKAAEGVDEALNQLYLENRVPGYEVELWNTDYTYDGGDCPAACEVRGHWGNERENENLTDVGCWLIVYERQGICLSGCAGCAASNGGWTGDQSAVVFSSCDSENGRLKSVAVQEVLHPFMHNTCDYGGTLFKECEGEDYAPEHCLGSQVTVDGETYYSPMMGTYDGADTQGVCDTGVDLFDPRSTYLTVCTKQAMEHYGLHAETYPVDYFEDNDMSEYTALNTEGLGSGIYEESHSLDWSVEHMEQGGNNDNVQADTTRDKELRVYADRDYTAYISQDGSGLDHYPDPITSNENDSEVDMDSYKVLVRGIGEFEGDLLFGWQNESISNGDGYVAIVGWDTDQLGWGVVNGGQWESRAFTDTPTLSDTDYYEVQIKWQNYNPDLIEVQLNDTNGNKIASISGQNDTGVDYDEGGIGWLKIASQANDEFRINQARIIDAYN